MSSSAILISFPPASRLSSSWLRSQIKDRSLNSRTIRHRSGDGPLRSSLGCLASPASPSVPVVPRPSHSIFPCSYLLGTRIPRDICEYGRESPIVKVVVARRAVSRTYYASRASSRESFPVCSSFSVPLSSVVPFPPSLLLAMRDDETCPLLFYFPRDRKMQLIASDRIFERQ